MPALTGRSFSLVTNGGRGYWCQGAPNSKKPDPIPSLYRGVSFLRCLPVVASQSRVYIPNQIRPRIGVKLGGTIRMQQTIQSLLRFSVVGTSALLVASAAASTVSGDILTYSPGVSGIAWQVHLVSDDNYAVDFTVPQGMVFPESPPGCGPLCGSAYPFPAGAVASLVGTSCPPPGSTCTFFTPITGSGTVDGVFYPSLVFGNSFAPPLTSPVYTALNLDSAPFTVASVGSPFPYEVPFTLSGQIQAALPPVSSNTPPTLLIDDQISGSGTVTFPLFPNGNGSYVLNTRVDWALAPEPGSADLLAGGALLALCARWVVRGRRRP